MSRLGVAVDTVRAVASEASESRVTFLAAAVAYFGFVSLLPLSLVALAVGSALGGERLAAFVVELAGDLLAPAGRDLVRTALTGASGRGGATVVGLLLLAWTALKLFRGLDVAFAEVYDADRRDPLYRQVADAALGVGVVAVAVVVVVLVGGILPLAAVPFVHLLAPVLLALALVPAFFPLYYLFPNVPVTAREVLPGTVFAAVGWTVLTGAFRVYVGAAGQFDLYGVLGGVLLSLTWLYLAGTVIILGAVTNRVLAGRPESDAGDAEDAPEEDGPAPDIVALDREVRALRERLEEKTVSRSTLEGELKAYVRSRVRRGHARGWGPYLVLLYGAGMTLGAFYLLSGGWAILAMVVVWLSTLGLYALMLLVGAGLHLAGLPGRAAGWVRDRRSGP